MKVIEEILKDNVVVNCQTEAEAQEYLNILDSFGYKWKNGEYLISFDNWDWFADKTYYKTDKVYKTVTISNKAKENEQIITYQQFKQLLNGNNMETKEFKIQVPEGYEIDKENSTFDCIKFKPIKNVLTYEDVAKELFLRKTGYYTDKFGSMCSAVLYDSQYLDSNNCTSEKQVQKLLAINKLMNVAKYLNGDWKPNWGDSNERKYYISMDGGNIEVSMVISSHCVEVYFKTPKLAQQAIEILGEETIKLALSTDW